MKHVPALYSVLNLLYPVRCIVCKVLGEPLLCNRCLQSIVPVADPFCARCGQSFISPDSPCSHCSRRAPAFDAARSMGAYGSVLRHAIHLFKYRDRPALARPLGVALASFARTRSSELGNLAFDAIIPVPMHPARQRVRGYNQSERLAAVVSAELNIPMICGVLSRTVNTRAQVGLTQEARQTNLAGAFSVPDAESVREKRVLLIDDVSTTTSSLHECAKTLKAAGATEVYAVTLAAG